MTRSAIESQFLLPFQPKTLCNFSDRPQALRGVGCHIYLSANREMMMVNLSHNTQGGTLSSRSELLVLLSVYSGSNSRVFFVNLILSYTGKGCQSKICQGKEIEFKHWQKQESLKQ